ncbi:hypothetical protein ABK730_23725 [Klebsiella indica]|uniref:hypothetical protein n=1 Tax=Klebsiella TaxID=570 RepID=UPI001486E37F|nr:hypothetical protein [Klebsiella indica]
MSYMDSGRSQFHQLQKKGFVETAARLYAETTAVDTRMRELTYTAFNLPAIILLYPKLFELQEGGDAVNPRERTPVRDWGERGKPTHMQLEV